MPRFLVLLFLLLAVTSTYAQRPGAPPELPHDPATGRVSYRRVVVAEAFSRAQLYARAQAWVRQHQHAPAGTSPLEAEALDEIIVQSEDTVVVRGTATAVVRHSLRFQIREGRFQYEFTDFSAPPFGNFENDYPRTHRRAWNRLRNNTDTQVKKWVSSLERAMMAREPAGGEF
jgi:hypothetical protein